MQPNVDANAINRGLASIKTYSEKNAIKIKSLSSQIKKEEIRIQKVSLK